MIVNIHDGPWQCEDSRCDALYTRRPERCAACGSTAFVKRNLRVAWGDDVTAICQGLVAIQGEGKASGQGLHVITKQSNIGGPMKYEHACHGKPADNTITWAAHELAWRLHVGCSDLHVLIRHCPYCGVGMHNPDHVGEGGAVLAGGQHHPPSQAKPCQPDPFPMQQSAALAAILESWPLHQTGDFLAVHIDHIMGCADKLVDAATGIAQRLEKARQHCQRF